MTTAGVISNPLDAFFEDATLRRLLKAQHHEMNGLDIGISTSVTFDKDDLTSPFTVYSIRIRNSSIRNNNTQEQNGTSTVGWLLKKRYSEFYRFRTTLIKDLQQWEKEWHAAGQQNSKAFVFLTKMLHQLLLSNFPRKHIRCDTKEIIRERLTGFHEFVRTLLSVYADLLIILRNCPLYPHHSSLQTIFNTIEAFLGTPQERSQSDNDFTNAILALEDTVHGGNNGSRTCCICLEECASDDDFYHQPQRDSGKFVRLPCSHRFHEDCAIGWLNASTTCPLCRQAAVTRDP